MIACAIACYAAAAGMVLFLPSLGAAGGAEASLLQLLQLMQPGRAGALWPGVLLFVLAAAGIVLTAMRTKTSLGLSVAAACAGAGLGVVSLLTSGITAQNLGDRIAALLLPLAFIWAAVCCGMLLYVRKQRDKAG